MKDSRLFLPTIAVCALLAGCARTVHSISNSGYQADRSYRGFHSGSWSVFSPAAFEDGRINRSPRRAVADQKLVESLKQKAYENGVKEILKLYEN